MASFKIGFLVALLLRVQPLDSRSVSHFSVTSKSIGWVGICIHDAHVQKCIRTLLFMRPRMDITHALRSFHFPLQSLFFSSTLLHSCSLCCVCVLSISGLARTLVRSVGQRGMVCLARSSIMAMEHVVVVFRTHKSLDPVTKLRRSVFRASSAKSWYFN